MLFYLSAETGTTADRAAPGTAKPAFDSDVVKIADGASGAALQCGDLQQLAWQAPGNIFAQRGTLMFAWRSRYPVGPTEFPVFRVGYADHSSWDMVWLRIDYNGHGFDAFVTDTGLSRIRVSSRLASFPAPTAWTHLALAWDERSGVKFYIDGKLAAENLTPACLDAALGYFGPHSRIISPHNVQSDYNWVRGGDIDELRIYDRMLSNDEIAALANGPRELSETTPPRRTLADPATARAWDQRFGWSAARSAAPFYSPRSLSVRKVEIHEAYDLKRWWWKANDGIAETTWPGVYNRSRLPGRNDYDQLPDWDCYVESGRAVSFALPEEPWNQLEITGAAWGQMELLPADTAVQTAFEREPDRVLFKRARGVHRTVHTFADPFIGRTIRFTNTEAEEPINELNAFHVTAGAAPEQARQLAFRLRAAPSSDPTLTPLRDFIAGRFPADERAMLFAEPAASAVSAQRTPPSPAGAATGLPFVHVLVPDTWDDIEEGLDGVVIELPSLPGSTTPIPLNIQIKDPLWPLRNLLDFTFCVQPGEPKTLWLDTRDRLLPRQTALWLTVAAAEPGIGAATLDGAEIRLVFKPRELARKEHAADRFTQAKDSYAMLVESNPYDPRYDLWVRFARDLEDLLRVDPDHPLGQIYASISSLRAPPPPLPALPEPPAGVPRWAFLQSELLRHTGEFVRWYIQHRQVSYGDFGGGISDDVDLTNQWPGLALMGWEPETVRRSLQTLLDAAYRNDMFTDGLPTIQADELHSCEEGISCLGQTLLLAHGSPRQLERAMVTARSLQRITGINAAGHRHILTSYFSGSRMATEEPWGRAKPHSYLVLHSTELLVDFNGSPAARQELLELTDGLLAHWPGPSAANAVWPPVIRFEDDKTFPPTRPNFPAHLFWFAWQWTGEQRYLQPIVERGPKEIRALSPNALDWLGLREEWTQHKDRVLPPAPPADPRVAAPPPSTAARYSKDDHLLWQLTGDKSYLEKLYHDQIAQCMLYWYPNTEGSLWIDRVGVPTTELQRARLGGVALVRMALLPGHTVSWTFAAPATARSVGILIPDATPTAFKVIVYNLETFPVDAVMTGWGVNPGLWEITQGINPADGDEPVDQLSTRDAQFERSSSLTFTFPPRTTTVLQLRLKQPGTPYWQRHDWGIDPEDVQLLPDEIRVTAHSLGAKPTPATRLALRDPHGRLVATAGLPPLPPPDDLEPKIVTVSLPRPAEVTRGAGWSIEIDPDHQSEEITRLNNVVQLP